MDKIEDNEENKSMLDLYREKHEKEISPKEFNLKVKCFFSNITVEPVLLFFQISSLMSNLTTQNLNLRKVCRVNLNYTEEICFALENKNATLFKNEEIVVQTLVANMLIWQTVIQNSIPCILVIFIGSWSDRHKKRKPFLLLPIFGELIRNTGLILCVYFFYELPLEVVGLVESLPSSIMGSLPVFYMAAFSYITDITSIKNRTMRIGLLNIAYGTAWSIGTAFSGVIFQKFGFYGVYYASTLLFLLAFIIALVRVREKHNTHKREVLIKSDETCMFQIMDFFSMNHFKSSIKVTFKKEPHRRTLKIIMIIILYFTVEGPVKGQSSVEYMFTRLKFGWDEVDYSIFSTFSTIINLLGIGIALGIFSKLLDFDDSTIGLIAVTSKLSAGFIFAFATSKFFFYFGVIVEIIFTSSHIIMRSILSKIVPPHEIGQVCSIIAIIQTLVPVIYIPLYSAIYKISMEIFPGFFFIFTSILLIPAFFIYLKLYLENKRSNLQTNS
ncbi:uncharacterized protein LOC126896376 isoform X2 [Daktulosphaira vitifoliae]|uniref:uncharacterized protein LOC126896376 isoform X2 n=1 Tax=Daktulosphaira vitifoliae TaxID=58002 RepID=UPI0021AA3860|nr:uncharacterized protein LOC126896376 isoform X2 [Daktulosphaira vitifoliae]